MDNLIAEALDPEHTVQVRCPDEVCKMRTFACCAKHAILGMQEHIRETH